MVSLNRLPRKLRPDRSKHQNLPPDNGKIGKEAFLYMEGKEGDDSFAQCQSCDMWNITKQRCAILGPDYFVDADDSCNLYIHGKPHDQKVEKLYEPADVGFVDRDVRCENCFYGGDECGLYKMLNQRMPETFDIDTKIKPYGCCSAQTAKANAKSKK